MSEIEPEKSASKRGGLTVSMLLALVAAIGVGLAVTRTLPEFLYLDQGNSFVHHHYCPSSTGGVWGAYPLGRSVNEFGSKSRSSWRRPSYWLDHLPYWSSPCLVSLTFAATGFGMRRSRSPDRAAWLPGQVVGIAVLLAMAIKLVECLALVVMRWHTVTVTWRRTWSWRGEFNGPGIYFWLTLAGPAALGVVVGWLALALRDRRPPAPDTREWFSRAIGWSWIVLALSKAIGTLCIAFNR